MGSSKSPGAKTNKPNVSPHDSTVQPAFSVLMATYNRAALLPRAIKSVLGQTFHDFELIVIDDASADDTAEVVRQIGDDRIRYVQLAENGGQSRALNAGITQAQGEYISFLDSDDEWLPTYLEEISDAFAKNEKAALVYARFVSGPNWTIAGADVYADVLSQGQLSSTSTLNIRATALRSVGGFRAAHNVCNDDDLCFRIAKHFAIDHVPKELTVMHATPGAVTGDAVRDAFGWAKLIDEYRPEILRNCGRHTLAYHDFRLAELMFGCGQMRQGCKYLSKATAELPGGGGPSLTLGGAEIARWYARVARSALRGGASMIGAKTTNA